MAGASRHGSWALSCSTLRSPNAVEEVCRLGLFRSAMPCQLLSSFGVIFQDSLSALLAAGNCKARCPTREQVQGAGEHVFAKSTETDHVDLFIGHSWKAGRWEKFFSLCTYFNLQFAIACSFTAWFVVVALLVGSMGVTGLGGSMLLFPCLVCFPMVTFAIVLIFGHELPLGRSLPTCWLDRICIHQTDMDKKKEQINALPVFVAQSSKMLVLWDQTYFERLWCNLELATCARYGGTDKVELMPLWLAPWLLSTILLDLSSAGILEIMVHLFPNYSAAWMHDIPEMSESIFGHNPVMESFVSSFDVWMFSGISYLPVSIPSFFCFRAKFLSHQLMLEQMSTFDVRAAHCTVASDRASIEEQVTALFSGMEDKTAAPLPSAVDDGEVVLQRFEPLQEDPLVRFNAFIRGNLREFVISQIGDELSVPYHICLVAFLPMIFYSSVNVLGCDNGPCASSAKLAGYRSVSEYMITQIVGWVLVFVLAFPLTYPLLLRMINCVLSFGDGPLQLLLAFLCCPLAYMYIYVCGGICWGAWLTLVKEPSPIQLLVFLLVLAALIMQLLWLFQYPSRRRAESCRCVKRQTYEALAHVQSGK